MTTTEDSPENTSEDLSPTNEPPQVVRRRSRGWMIGWLIIGAAAGLLMILVLVLPQVAASRWVIDPLTARLSAGDLRIHVDDVSLGWFSPLAITGLKVDGNLGGEIFRVEQVQTHRSLLGLLLNHKHIGAVDIEQPIVNLTMLEQGTNFRALINTLLPPDRDRTQKRVLETEVAARIRGLRFEVRRGEANKPLLATSSADLELNYSAPDKQPRLSLQPVKLLDHADLTPELFAYGMEFVLPVLADATVINGQISLDIDSANLPLHEVLDFDVDGVVTIHAVGVESRSPLVQSISSTLSKILRRPEVTRVVLVDGSEIEVSVRDRRVWHRGVRFGLPQIDPDLVLETSGTVGFDRSLDLTLQIPLPMRLMLANTESPSGGGDQIRPLTIPITGSLDKPVVEWAAAKTELLTLLSIASDSWGENEEGSFRATILSTAEEILGSKGGEGESLKLATDAALQLWKQRRQNKQDRQADQPLEEPNERPRRRIGDFFRNLGDRSEDNAPPTKQKSPRKDLP